MYHLFFFLFFDIWFLLIGNNIHCNLKVSIRLFVNICWCYDTCYACALMPSLCTPPSIRVQIACAFFFSAGAFFFRLHVNFFSSASEHYVSYAGERFVRLYVNPFFCGCTCFRLTVNPFSLCRLTFVSSVCGHVFICMRTCCLSAC